MDPSLLAWVHLVAAAVLVGGGAVVGFAVVPYARGLPELERAALLEGVGRRLRPLSWVCLVVLFGTGLSALAERGLPVAVVFRPEEAGGPFGRALAWKLLLFWILVLLQAVQDLVLAPLARRLVREAYAAPPDARAERLGRAERVRRWSGWVHRSVALAGLGVLYFAAVLARS
ncbi:hypothetical protein HRbin32_00041 [bacterium HR32]|jgi:uncharacterized membrane protein|nr:hypothetical protein HRbin32_00041 [bacterium HR32]